MRGVLVAMSRRFENGYFALVLVCAIGLLAIAFVSFTFAYSKGYQSADQEHSAYYANRNDAEIHYSECLKISSSLSRARQCIKDAETASRESERAEQDLNAQREMAQWAEGMLWAAWLLGILTFGATVIGVRFVYLTLIATQNMANDARKIGGEANAIVASQFRASYGILIGAMASSRQPLAVFMMRPEDRLKLMGDYPPLIGHVIYSDPMGVRYRHNFAFVATHYRDGSYKRYGGRTNNGEYEIKDGN